MAGGLEVLYVCEDLHDLTGVLGGEAVDEGLADFVAEEVVEGGAERFVDDGGLLEVVVAEEVDLVEEVADVDAAEGVHLGEGEDTREAGCVLVWI